MDYIDVVLEFDAKEHIVLEYIKHVILNIKNESLILF